ncbi:hypothetical protein [Sedimentisphaera salicampi]|uniref:UDP-N-acetyl-D-glucosamine 6-dehydrogenase n=1 Tax=Sedimentisphaera salicampi TaxID=1941349 RepID=A0A1W6LKM4_9BACT|nr:hypothetical protein [Sedimentisphaera salicampi]ARN56302.1 UDP-N-acetyl-D-glucosamine 6-dehydrogenase [Sedimentisphaera salicampi]
MKSRKITPKMLAGFDAVLIATDHSDYDYQMITDNAQLVIDTRNSCDKCKSAKKKVWKA